MFADFRSAINATSATFKRPFFPRRGTKNAVYRSCNNIGAVSCTRFLQDQTIIPHQRLGFFKHSFKDTQRTVFIPETSADIDKLLADPLIAE